MRRKRFSSLARFPGVAPLHAGLPSLPLGSRAVIGSVAAKLLERALLEPGAQRLDIVIFSGPALEPWNPESLALLDADPSRVRLWELGRDLASLGHRVRVFAPCADREGNFQGVEWLHEERFGDLSCDLLLSTEPAALEARYDVRARVNLLWLADERADRAIAPALDRKLDAYLCPSAADLERFRRPNSSIAREKLMRFDGALARDLERISTELLASKRLDIVIFTGPGLEPWNPDTLRQNGLGGSETMAWELSRHLVALGHRVRVFADCSGMEGLFEGVEWLDYRRFRELTCDVLLSSREPAAVDTVHAIQTKLRLLWVHDVHCGDKLTATRDGRTDAYLCLSAWHVACFRQHHPQIDARKVLQIRNGIDLDDFPATGSEIRDPHRAIYSSCPSRGLKIALDVWPQVRAAVPDATLHVYYGFANWERRATLDDDRAALRTIAEMKLQLANTEGVVFHGRLNPRELAEHFRAASVWTYPDWFHETSCLTAMQAQAAGLRIVTSALAALNETVADRGVLLREDPHSDAYRVAFTQATIAALLSEPNNDDRVALHRYAARHFDLPRLTTEFVSLFRALIQQKSAASRRA